MERDGKVGSPRFQRTPFAEINEFRSVWNFPDNDCASGTDQEITFHRLLSMQPSIYCLQIFRAWLEL